MIGAIAGATFVVHDLAACEEAYRDLLGYKVVSRSDVTQADAEHWHAPLIIGAPMITMYPASGEPVFLRFIEDRETIAHPALTTHGWIAAELAVQDVEALAVRLRDSVFSIIGPPAILDGFPMIKAMQVVGPGGECLYLTEVGPGAPMHLAPAQSFVGRIFIAVAGGHALDEARHGYARVGNAVSETVPVVSVVVANANDMDDDHATSIALVTLDEGTLLELDRLPDSAGHRPRPMGKLAHGFAVLSCFSSQVDRPHMMIGGFGEMIELLPSPPRPA